MDCPDLISNGLKPIMSLGSGTYGDVYLSEDTNGIIHAVKVMKSTKISSPVELHIQTIFNNPYIMKINSVSFADNITISMPIGNMGLYSYILSKPIFNQRISIARKLLEGLHCLHSNGVLHNDIKLNNILTKITSYGSSDIYEPVLIDFGLSTLVKSSIDGFASHMDFGTVANISLDILTSRNGKIFNNKSDMWAMGLILFFIFTGEPFINARGNGITNNDEIKRLVIDFLTIKGDYNTGYDKFIKERLIKIKGVLIPSDKYDLVVDLLTKVLDISPKRRSSAGSALEHELFKYIDTPISTCEVNETEWPPENWESLDLENIKTKVKTVSKLIVSNGVLGNARIEAFFNAIDLTYRYLSSPSLRGIQLSSIPNELLANAVIDLSVKMTGANIREDQLNLPPSISMEDVNRAEVSIINVLGLILHRRFMYESIRSDSEGKELNEVMLDPVRYFQYSPNPVNPLSYIDNTMYKYKQINRIMSIPT